MFSKQDTAILRRLALQVKEAARRDNSEEKIAFWKRHTSLKGERPAVFVFPDSSYGELIPWSELECEDAYAKSIEMQLRKVLFQAEVIQDDVPILDTVTVEKVIHNTMWGLEIKREWNPGNKGAAFHHVCVIEDPDDWDKLSKPVVSYDEQTTMERYDAVCEAVGDILKPELVGRQSFLMSLMHWYSDYRGLDNLLIDLVEEPEMVHSVMRFFTDGYIDMCRQYEAQNLISLNNNHAYHYTGGVGYNEELPGADFDPNHVKLKNIWGAAEAQELAVVSPAMHEEFALTYEREYLQLFGLNGYGCCEDLGKKLQYVLKIPNLRRVAVCPWADISDFAPVLKDQYLMTWKPQPAYLAFDRFGREEVEKELTEGIRKARGGRLELILRDTTTVRKEPERFTQWVKIARKAIAENWE